MNKLPFGYTKVYDSQGDVDRVEQVQGEAAVIRGAFDLAMILWLVNDTNHKDAPNENYGRELLELFSMGVGNYTEDDVKACTRAFTGWTIVNYIARYPWGAFPLEFEYRPEDHDDDEKEFLGHTGRFEQELHSENITVEPGPRLEVLHRHRNLADPRQPELMARHHDSSSYSAPH